LGEIVFAHSKKLQTLNRIVHPPLLTKVRQEIRKQKGLVILDAALLFNWGLEKEMDASILVSAPKRLKIERAPKAGMTRKVAEERMSRQLPERIMAKRTDFIIKNIGTQEDLRNQAEELWQLFNKCRLQ
jgi:dephospho-CoA kinase